MKYAYIILLVVLVFMAVIKDGQIVLVVSVL